MSEEKFSYEDKSSLIDKEIRKRKGKWFLTSLNWFDFEDVEQIIRAHIHAKWDQWDQSRPIEPWINKIISNQMKNILRNHYGNFSRPCLSCPFNQSDNLCAFTSSGIQDESCPLFLKWSKTKKAAYQIKMPLAMEHHGEEASRITTNELFNFEDCIDKIHNEMKKVLSEKQFNIYKMLFIDNMEEEDVAIKMGYKTTEKGRKAGYKQIKNLKKSFKLKMQEILEKKDILYE